MAGVARFPSVSLPAEKKKKKSGETEEETEKEETHEPRKRTLLKMNWKSFTLLFGQLHTKHYYLQHCCTLEISLRFVSLIVELNIT